MVGDKRLESLPDLPTAREQGVDVSVVKFRGLAGPKGTPPAVVAAWEAGVQKLLADPKYKAIYTHNNLQPGFMAQKEYAQFIADFGDETQKFLKDTGVIK